MSATTYKVQVDDGDHYSDRLDAAKTIYALGEETGCDCVLWEQTWTDGQDEPKEDVLMATFDLA